MPYRHRSPKARLRKTGRQLYNIEEIILTGCQKMKLAINIMLFMFIIIGGKPGDDPLPPNIHCTDGLMKQAFCESGQDFSIQVIKKSPDDFTVWVDTHSYAVKFISFREKLARYHSTLDNSNVYFNISIEGLNDLSDEQKLEKIKQKKLSLIQQADSLHLYNNTNKKQVYLINNTKDTVAIQMQDWEFICILQAKAYNDKWYPVQYWRFSDCGLSYYLKYFPPETANSFVTELPDKGDFETTLRYKLLGKDKFYYSNEFPGKIDYCEFIADSSIYPAYPEDIFLDSLKSYWDY